MRRFFNFSKVKMLNLVANIAKLSIASYIVFSEPPKCITILHQPKRPESMRIEK